MRILLVSDPPLRGSFGGARPFVELGEELRALGWEVTVRSLSEELPGDPARMREQRARLLHEIVASEGSAYNVVDFDHGYLPFPRGEFPEHLLLVARSVLLCQQVAERRFPQPLTTRRMLGSVLKGHARRRSRLEMLRFGQRTVEQADLVNLSNGDDRLLLARNGVPDEKLLVLPFGLSEARAAQFDALDLERGHGNVVAFVGTFDWRKGAADMPRIVEQVAGQAPEASFRLLGTRGMFRTRSDVARRFPRKLRARVEIVPEFAASALPQLLDDCALGFFPSYLEGFPFAVLEMLAAGLPVVAYDAPGAPMMLGRELLVGAGDSSAMAHRIGELIDDPRGLAAARREARRRSQEFRWRVIARETDSIYRRQVGALRAAPAPQELVR